MANTVQIITDAPNQQVIIQQVDDAGVRDDSKPSVTIALDDIFYLMEAEGLTNIEVSLRLFKFKNDADDCKVYQFAYLGTAPELAPTE